MKTKKYISVIISIISIWLLIAISEKIDSHAYTIFMYIAFALILIALFVYQVILRISLIKILTKDMNPQKFLVVYKEFDGNKYTNDRYIYEALAYILTGEFACAENLLKKIKSKKNEIIKIDAILTLCYFFGENYGALSNATASLKKHFNENSDNKLKYYLNFAILVEAIVSDKPLDSRLIEQYFNSIPKKNIIEVYIASYLLGEAKLKLGAKDDALALFKHIANSECKKTILYGKSVSKIEIIKNLGDDSKKSRDGSKPLKK